VFILRRAGHPRHFAGVVVAEAEALGAVVLGQPAGDDESHTLAHVDSVITDPFVEARYDGQLHSDLQIDPAGSVTFEDRLDELLLQAV
jgi:hypothetical protein